MKYLPLLIALSIAAFLPLNPSLYGQTFHAEVLIDLPVYTSVGYEQGDPGARSIYLTVAVAQVISVFRINVNVAAATHYNMKLSLHHRQPDRVAPGLPAFAAPAYRPRFGWLANRNKYL